MSIINYLTSKNKDVKFITKILRWYDVTTTMYSQTSMIIEIAFITHYKKVMISKTPGEGICKKCNVKNDEKYRKKLSVNGKKSTKLYSTTWYCSWWDL